MADNELTDPGEIPSKEELIAEQRARMDAAARQAWMSAPSPFGVFLELRIFYFGRETPGESSWEVSGEWVEEGDEILIKKMSVFPSRRVFDSDGNVSYRDPDSVPEGGLNRDIMRRLGSDARIRRVIKRQDKSEAKFLKREITPETEVTDWMRDRISQDQPGPMSKPFEWWVARADEYLAMASKLGTTYGAQAQLADASAREDYWGTGIPGTRWRMKRIRDMGLIDEDAPLPRPGPNHPRRKEKENG